MVIVGTLAWWRFFLRSGARAKYEWPTATSTLRRRVRSRTVTLPRVTVVVVPAHVSVTLHFVPRTVAVEFVSSEHLREGQLTAALQEGADVATASRSTSG